MDEGSFRRRTKQMVLRVIRLAEALPNGEVGHVISRQILRSATSVRANYRVACRAKSRADMIAKLAIRLEPLTQEVDELTAMIVASIKILRVDKPDVITRMTSKIENPKWRIYGSACIRTGSKTQSA